MNMFDHQQSQKTHRKIDVKDPAPGIAVGNPSSQSWADHRGDHNPDAISSHRGAVLMGRKAFQQNGLGQGLHAAAADAL